MKKLLALRNKKGFTLVELIVVIAIIAVLVAIAVPAMVSYINNAKQQVNASNCRAVVSAATSANAAVLAGVDKSSTFQAQVAKLLVDGAVGTYGTYGGGTYEIWGTPTGGTDAEIVQAGTPTDWKGGKITKVVFKKDKITATWEDDNTMTFGTY